MTRGSAVFACALACGIVLRLIWPADMEWKADEQRMFTWASTIGITEPWPPIGMASGVAVPNPGLSVWLFVPLARATSDPVALAQVVQVVNVIALVGFVLLGASRVVDESARQSWFAGLALMSVNPIAVVLARKIWAQSLLPVFTLVTLAAHAGRGSWAGAFIWGLAGALMGQVHMSGFFLQGALVLFTLTATFRWKESTRTRWGAWLIGSIVGAIPLWPWALNLLRAESGFSRDWIATLVPRAPYNWLIDSLGVNTSYIYHPESLWFLGEPRIGGVPTYGMAIAHAALIAIALFCLVRWLKTIRRPQIVPSARRRTRVALDLCGGLRHDDAADGGGCARPHALPDNRVPPAVRLAWLATLDSRERPFVPDCSRPAAGHHGDAHAAGSSRWGRRQRRVREQLPRAERAGDRTPLI